MMMPMSCVAATTVEPSATRPANYPPPLAFFRPRLANPGMLYE
jgi:hypothetical protein